MKFRKFLCFVLIFAIMMSLGVTAFAEDINSYDSKIVFDDTLNASLRSLSKPTKEWVLKNHIYKANLELVSTSWLYTNYYFHCSDSGKILLEGMVYSDTGRPTPMKIGVYSLTTKRFVDSYTVESSLKGTYFTHSFNGLYKSSKYAIAFVAVYDGFSHDSVHGWCYIK